ncbi:hypothetical protein HMPREF9080_01441, partial [Cardiobacterium valvarum F0432]
MAGMTRLFFRPPTLSCRQEPLIARDEKIIAVHPCHQLPSPVQPAATKPH